MNHGALGKKNARFDSRTLKLAHYKTATYVPPPFFDNTLGMKSFGMMLNGPNSYVGTGSAYIDQGIGDCTIAAVGHAIQIFTKNTITPPDSLILQKYEQWDGFDINNPQATDNGGECLTVLTDWKNQTFGGHVLKGFVDPQPQNFGHIMHSIAEFGGVYIGLQLPMSAQTQINAGQIWDVVADDGGVWGGHCVFCPAYHVKDTMASGANTITCITWGGLQKMTVAFWDKYCDESHTLLASAWQPKGIALAQLWADLQSING
jgi:hypothetical protein